MCRRRFLTLFADDSILVLIRLDTKLRLLGNAGLYSRRRRQVCSAEETQNFGPSQEFSLDARRNSEPRPEMRT